MKAMVRGMIQEHLFYSKELNEEVKLFVYLPSSYTPLQKHYVLIAQDGPDYFKLGRLGSIVDELLLQHEIENLIIIGIPYKDLEDRRKKYHPNGEKHLSYIRFLAHELISFIDREFPTLQMGLSRALIGESLAGTVSLLTALQYPNTFGHVILQSPFVNQAVLDKCENAADSNLNILHTVGLMETEVETTDGEIKDFLTPNRQLSQLLRRKGFPYLYEELTGSHNWKLWQTDLPRAIKHIFH